MKDIWILEPTADPGLASILLHSLFLNVGTLQFPYVQNPQQLYHLTESLLPSPSLYASCLITP